MYFFNQIYFLVLVSERIVMFKVFANYVTFRTSLLCICCRKTLSLNIVLFLVLITQSLCNYIQFYIKKKSSSSGLFFGKLALMKLVLNEAGKSLKQQIPCPVSSFSFVLSSDNSLYLGHDL